MQISASSSPRDSGGINMCVKEKRVSQFACIMNFMKKKKMEEHEETKEEEEEEKETRAGGGGGTKTVLKRKTQTTSTSIREGDGAAAVVPPPPMPASQPLINLPPNYQHTPDVYDGVGFVHPLPYIVGYRKYHMLNRPWTITLRDKIEGYLTSANNIGIWNMPKADVGAINSAIFDFVSVRQLHGHVIYMGEYAHHVVDLDRMSRFFVAPGQLVSVDRMRYDNDFSQVDGELTLKITGFYEEMVVGHIYAILTVDHMKLTRRRGHWWRQRDGELYDNHNATREEEEDEGHVCSDVECREGECLNDGNKENKDEHFHAFVSTFL